MTQKKLKSKNIKWIDNRLCYFSAKMKECISGFELGFICYIDSCDYYNEIVYLKRKIRQLKLLRKELNIS